MSDETVQAESAETADSAQPPEIIPAEETAEPQPALPAARQEAAPNLYEEVRDAALDAERTVVESQYSEGLGPKKPAERKTKIKR
jgi:hypothetical protein